MLGKVDKRGPSHDHACPVFLAWSHRDTASARAAAAASYPAWALRWPAATDRLEVIDGALSFGLRGFSSKKRWDTEDVELACRVYLGQRVWLSDSRVYLFVAPPAP